MEKHKRGIRLLIGLAAAVFAFSTVSMANILPVGGAGGNGDDWTQEFCTVNCAGAPNAMALTELQFVIETAGATFTDLSTAYSDEGLATPQPGWSTGILYDGGTGAFIYGPPASNELYMTIGFSSPPEDPITFVAQFWSGTAFDPTDSGKCSWDGSSWSCGSLTSPDYGEAAEPSSLVLLSWEFLGIGLVVLRRLRV